MNNLVILWMVVIFMILAGICSIIFAKGIREFYFKSYRSGIERIGFLTSWIDRYPGPWMFRLWGVAAIGFAIAIIIIITRKH
jgi:hypothetical protein